MPGLVRNQAGDYFVVREQLGSQGRVADPDPDTRPENLEDIAINPDVLSNDKVYATWLQANNGLAWSPSGEVVGVRSRRADKNNDGFDETHQYVVIERWVETDKKTKATTEKYGQWFFERDQDDGAPATYQSLNSTVKEISLSELLAIESNNGFDMNGDGAVGDAADKLIAGGLDKPALVKTISGAVVVDWDNFLGLDSEGGFYSPENVNWLPQLKTNSGQPWTTNGEIVGFFEFEEGGYEEQYYDTSTGQYYYDWINGTRFLSVIEKTPAKDQSPAGFVEHVLIESDDDLTGQVYFELDQKSEVVHTFELLGLEINLNMDLKEDNAIGDQVLEMVMGSDGLGSLYVMESSTLYFSISPSDYPTAEALPFLNGEIDFVFPDGYKFLSGFENDLGELEIILSSHQGSSHIAKFYLSDEFNAYSLNSLEQVSSSTISLKEFRMHSDINGDDLIASADFVETNDYSEVNGSSNF